MHVLLPVKNARLLDRFSRFNQRVHDESLSPNGARLVVGSSVCGRDGGAAYVPCACGSTRCVFMLSWWAMVCCISHNGFVGCSEDVKHRRKQHVQHGGCQSGQAGPGYNIVIRFIRGVLLRMHILGTLAVCNT